MVNVCGQLVGTGRRRRRQTIPIYLAKGDGMIHAENSESGFGFMVMGISHYLTYYDRSFSFSTHSGILSFAQCRFDNIICIGHNSGLSKRSVAD
jgi:hypothetical protein